MSKKLRLDKILGNMGYGTRKEVKRYIRDGQVKIDGKVIKKSSIQVDPYESHIEINGEEVMFREYIYIMLNKPKGVISATYDPSHKTVIDLIDEYYSSFDLFPMGRLDIDTEGLLILTNDGKLSHEILSPKNHIPKTYYAHIEGRVTEEDAVRLARGVTLEDGYKALPGELKIIESDNISKIELTIYEGKFHQVKRMFKALNKEVVYLKRISMGALFLDESLETGSYRELDEDELKLLKDSDES